MFETWPEIREIRLQEIGLTAMQTVDVDAVPIHDERGDLMRDESGRVLYGD